VGWCFGVSRVVLWFLDVCLLLLMIFCFVLGVLSCLCW